jgi:hypothetical protein
LNGVNLGSPDTTAPYAISWNTSGAADGIHVLRAIARDAVGATTVSASRVVTVQNGGSPVATCPSVRPGSNWVCYQGGWLPPDVFLQPPSAPVIPPPSVPSAPAAPSAPSVCASVRPGADWVCYSGAWMPPGMLVPSSGVTIPPLGGGVPTTTGCSSDRPGADWVCSNGSWLPQNHPALRP